MSHRFIERDTKVDYLSDRADGGDDYLKKADNPYNRVITRGSKADIWWHVDVWRTYNGEDWFYDSGLHQCVQSEYSMSYAGQFDRARADACGMSVTEACDILDIRLIKRIQGESVDPTMFLSELDSNFAMVTKRVEQAAVFLKNLRNPKRLAQLTLRYFKGSETRRSLTSRYSRARRMFLRRTARWKTRDWSTSYLEYQFGWRPLCDDIWKLIGLAREAKRRHNQFQAKVGLKPQEWSEIWHNAGPTGRDSDIGTCIGSTSGHARIRFIIDNPWLRQGASLEPPAYTAWDSVSYSWLADCVTNVGDHLKYILYHSGLGLIGGYKAVLRKLECHVRIDNSPVVSRTSSVYQTEYYEVNGALTHSSVHNLRQVYYEWPAVPWFNKYENTMKNTELLVTIGAFLHQLLAKMADNSRPWILSPRTP